MRKNTFKKGNVPWNKGKTGVFNHSDKVRNLMRLQRKGRKLSIAHRFAISEAVPKGEKHKNWKGGIYPKNLKERWSVKSKVWRSLVISRDKKCVNCGSVELLQADHIKPFALFPEARYDIKNGRTLCFECHKKTDTYGGKSHSKVVKVELDGKTYKAVIQ